MGGADGGRVLSPRGAVRRLLGVLCLLGCGCAPKTDWQPLDLKDRAPEQELNDALSTKQTGILRFGFAERAGPEEEARQYLPLLRYLELSTGYRFALHFTPRQVNIVDELGRGEVQFAAIGAMRYLQAREKYGAVLLVRGLTGAEQAEYRSLILVPPDSPVHRIEDLRGKRFAFGHPDSMPGYYIPAFTLEEHGIGLRDLGGYLFTGSHQKCANALITGFTDACGIQEPMGRELARAGQARILFISRAFPTSGIAANRDVPPETLAKVREALLDFQPRGRDAEGLYDWEKTEMPLGFVAAREDDYNELRRRFQHLEAGGAGRESMP